MSGIAHLLLRQGNKVSGSDLKPSAVTDELQKCGAQIYIGHAAENLNSAEEVIYSTAIKEDNPELIAAEKKKLPITRRAQALAGLMKECNVITVTGSHGKTTTSSLAAYILMEANFMPTVVIGGILKNIDNNACLGKGSYFVAEADESDGSFLYYRPKFSIITNIDREHLDYFKDFESELKAFKSFINQTRSEGCLFLCYDDINLRNISRDYRGKVVYFGLNENADIFAKEIIRKGLSGEFDCYYKRKFIGRFSLPLAGLHNISNSLAAVALGLELGIDTPVILKALANFKGAKRRMDVKFDDGKSMVIDDYAHHPTEIIATLAAAKGLGKRTLAVFQPHRYSRTKLLLDDFAKAFDIADCLIITDIYPAGEAEIPGISAELIYEKVKQHDPVKKVYFSPYQELGKEIMRLYKEGDLILVLGAGDITKVSDGISQILKSKSQACRAA